MKTLAQETAEAPSLDAMMDVMFRESRAKGDIMLREQSFAQRQKRELAELAEEDEKAEKTRLAAYNSHQAQRQRNLAAAAEIGITKSAARHDLEAKLKLHTGQPPKIGKTEEVSAFKLRRREHEATTARITRAIDQQRRDDKAAMERVKDAAARGADEKCIPLRAEYADHARNTLALIIEAERALSEMERVGTIIVGIAKANNGGVIVPMIPHAAGNDAQNRLNAMARRFGPASNMQPEGGELMGGAPKLSRRAISLNAAAQNDEGDE